MRIGIDARFLTHTQVGGFKTYTVNLVNALSQVDTENSYVIYLDRPPVGVTLPQRDGFTYQVVDGTMPAFGMPLREQITLKRRIERDDLNVVHFLCNTAPVRAAGRFVVTLHDTIQVTIPQAIRLVGSLAEYKRWAMTAYSKWTICRTAQSARRIITVSNYEKTQIMTHLGIAPQRICVTRLAPDPVFASVSLEARNVWRTEMRQRLRLPDRYVLGIGYEPRKNIPLLIEAFSRIAPGHPGIDLVIVAAQERMRRFFEQSVIEQRLDDRVVVLGALPPSDLAVLYNLAEVFVYPSERESFGLPPLEALACGTPTIAMNMSSLPEILQDGAMLVDGKDVQVWADAIVQIITDENLRSSLVSRGLQQAAKLTWQRCARETIQVYCAVADES